MGDYDGCVLEALWRMSNHRMSTEKTDKIKKILWEYNKSCPICDLPLPGIKKSTIDHIVPVCKGGSNDISNLQLTHNECNNFKGNHLDVKLFKKKKVPYHGELIKMINTELKRTTKKTLKGL